MLSKHVFSEKQLQDATALLVAAEAIMAMRNELCGYIKLLFQSGEEGGNGAGLMVKAGSGYIDSVFHPININKAQVSRSLT